VRADCDRLPDRQVRHRDEGGGHRGRRLSDRDHVKAAASKHPSDLGIRERACDHTIGAHRVDTGTDDSVEIFSESGNGNRQ